MERVMRSPKLDGLWSPFQLKPFWFYDILYPCHGRTWRRALVEHGEALWSGMEKGLGGAWRRALMEHREGPSWVTEKCRGGAWKRTLVRHGEVPWCSVEKGLAGAWRSAMMRYRGGHLWGMEVRSQPLPPQTLRSWARKREQDHIPLQQQAWNLLLFVLSVNLFGCL